MHDVFVVHAVWTDTCSLRNNTLLTEVLQSTFLRMTHCCNPFFFARGRTQLVSTVPDSLLHVLQVDEEPSIRANTTVLLGNIAPNLGPSACKRVLLNAFARALRDVYPPSRAAALRALVATAPYHAPQAVAARVVPAISPLMLDPQSDVRAAANQVLITNSLTS